MHDSFANVFNRDWLDDAYERWRRDPESVDVTLRAFFAGMEFGGNGHSPAASAPRASADVLRQTGVVRLVNAYRELGHLEAHLDPLRLEPPRSHPMLALEHFGLSEADLDQDVDVSMVHGMKGLGRLRDLVQRLRRTYCGTIGVEYMSITDVAARAWLAERMESRRNRPRLPLRQKYRILITLHQALLFEEFLHKKYQSQKRFSLEGGETLIPILDALVSKSPSLGIRELVIGMAHRGRLNVLVNILGKSFEEVFNEFEDQYIPDLPGGDGDVKYHLGFSADVSTPAGPVHVSLAPNPSHLEIIGPIVIGRVRAKQRLHADHERKLGVPILIHGDAAIAGQGVVMETLNLSKLSGYEVGGTVHIVINNQIGFTTNPSDARSSRYCTDIAKMIDAPVFHVNADDPEAAVYVAELALEFRQQFQRDVFIDMVCYRKYGHNEQDEPGYTQPLMYETIRRHEPVTRVYARRLAGLPFGRGLDEEVSDAIDADFQTQLEDALRSSDALVEEYQRKMDTALAAVRGAVQAGQARKKGMEGFGGRWQGFMRKYSHEPVETGVPRETLHHIAQVMTQPPEGFIIHPKLKTFLENRRKSVVEGDASTIDWGTAEMLAFGTLLLEGTPIRLSGQDARRGTFSQRHAVFVDTQTNAYYYPLQHLGPQQAGFEVYDSPLSEAAVMGFEFGYSMDDPHSLVLWEAQFGDFANGAQVVIDQFLASSESKWNRVSGLVLLLPHGYEGQGPEHSSARLERFLQLAAEENIQVVYPSTAAQHFHLLRRQVKRPFRKPLIVMTPKSMLRNKAAFASIGDLTTGHFREVIDDPTADPDQVIRVVLCSGKVYHDLTAERARRATQAVAIIRLEQFYPWPEQQLLEALSRYRRAREWVWCQEESHNNGGWFFIEPRLNKMSFPIQYVGRDPSASPATGSHHIHALEQRELVQAAFEPPLPFYVTGWRTRTSLPAAEGGR